eukprot:gb/GEZJ01003306.1/.p2 GENE.gb/GEZJ01003306.1/~~gb/GEZJ01003306.1/.p2  ORF type:complete len:209 (-),score=28.50 gb/GEZJ01003306.1/:1907-2533(-)
MTTAAPPPLPTAKQNGTSTPAANVLRALTSLASLSQLSSALSTSVPALAPHTENAKTHFSALWTSAKPWAEFFNGKKFVPPASAAELQERLVDNLTYFSSNYLLCFLILSTASVLIHPLSFLCIVLIVALYVFLFLHNADTVRIGPLQLTANSKKIAFAALSLLLLYVTNAIGIIGSWALFGVILSLIHAACRVSAKEPDFESPVQSV